MCSFQIKTTKCAQRQIKTQSEKKKQASRPDLDMEEIWNLSSQVFKITTYMLGAVMEKVDNMQDLIDNVSKQMKTVRKN